MRDKGGVKKEVRSWKSVGLGMERGTPSRETGGGADSGQPDSGYPGQMAEVPTRLSNQENRLGIRALPLGRGTSR